MYPAFQQITPNNHGPWVVVTSYIFIPLTILVVIIRLATRYQITRMINLNDYLIVGSTVSRPPQTVLTPTNRFGTASGIHTDHMHNSGRKQWSGTTQACSKPIFVRHI